MFLWIKFTYLTEIQPISFFDYSRFSLIQTNNIKLKEKDLFGLMKIFLNKQNFI